jgi:hypothetical protein
MADSSDVIVVEELSLSSVASETLVQPSGTGMNAVKLVAPPSLKENTNDSRPTSPFIGLRNRWGENYCYLNSLLQLLQNTSCRGLLENLPIGEKQASSLAAVQRFFAEYRAAVQSSIESGKGTVLDPLDLRKVMEDANGMYKKGIMNDPSEAWNCLLESLHRDTADEHRKPIDGHCQCSIHRLFSTTVLQTAVCLRHGCRMRNKRQSLPVQQFNLSVPVFPLLFGDEALAEDGSHTYRSEDRTFEQLVMNAKLNGDKETRCCTHCGEPALMTEELKGLPASTFVLHLSWYEQRPKMQDIERLFLNVLQEHFALNQLFPVSLSNDGGDPFQSVASVNSIVAWRGQHYFSFLFKEQTATDSESSAESDPLRPGTWWLVNDSKNPVFIGRNWRSVARAIVECRAAPVLIGATVSGVEVVSNSSRNDAIAERHQLLLSAAMLRPTQGDLVQPRPPRRLSHQANERDPRQPTLDQFLTKVTPQVKETEDGPDPLQTLMECADLDEKAAKALLARFPGPSGLQAALDSIYGSPVELMNASPPRSSLRYESTTTMIKVPLSLTPQSLGVTSVASGFPMKTFPSSRKRNREGLADELLLGKSFIWLADFPPLTNTLRKELRDLGATLTTLKSCCADRSRTPLDLFVVADPLEMHQWLGFTSSLKPKFTEDGLRFLENRARNFLHPGFFRALKADSNVDALSNFRWKPEEKASFQRACADRLRANSQSPESKANLQLLNGLRMGKLLTSPAHCSPLEAEDL